MREQEQFLHVLDRDEAERRFRAAIDLTPRGVERVPLDEALGRRGFPARTVVATLEDAVVAAAGLARDGDVVLLAPGYKSFDQFRDFEDRGHAFREAVERIATHAVSRD